MIRIGKVSSINENNGTAKVVFLPENIVSNDLFILMPFTLGKKAYYMPEINETVVCIQDINKTGFILGSFYSENRTPSECDKNKIYIDFGDGSKVLYNKAEKSLNLLCDGEINIIGKKVIVKEIG